ncbi:RHS repeat-associated core domain-containing protein [Pseudomonas viridiflava]|uniref:RHS repeat-associated core domain-containing protein n=1 Tax=Pseudomonas viridiflava TaxID=33069 RepID=A0A3M5NWQ2_PSEVI|nr:RHS repeat-associated core domain-containing protein [Pseudomonas viridiflava]RMT76888.1 hypothetical protein ALP40_04072 [Pseudomonas viridiflava]
MAWNTVLCRYRYDPLDRIASRTPLAGLITQALYQSDVLVNELQGAELRRFFQHGRSSLACQTLSDQSSSTLLTATDHRHSVLNASRLSQRDVMAYTPYGHNVAKDHLPGFNGEHPDPVTGHYLLGNGYRAYSPVLMRFNSPDSLSPFGKGGLNAYAYCEGDPVNRSDPSGHDILDDVLTAAYIGVGLLTAGIGLVTARPALKAVVKGVKVKPGLPGSAAQGAMQTRPANTAEKLSAAVAVGAVAAGSAWAAAFAVRKADPDSAVARPLTVVALALAVPTLSLRGWTLARSELAKRAMKSVPVLVRRSSVRSLNQNVRLPALDIRETAL